MGAGDVIPPNLWPWRTIGKVAVPALMLLVAWWQIRAYADRVADEREGEIRALWEADTAKRDAVAKDQQVAADTRKADAANIGKEIDHELEAKYAAAVSERDDTLRLLQRSRNEVRACASNRATDSLVASDRAAHERARAIDEAIAGTVTEHRLNAEQLSKLQDFLRRQRVCPIRVE